MLSKQSVLGTIESNNREKSTPKNKISGDRKMLVKQHIAVSYTHLDVYKRQV